MSNSYSSQHEKWSLNRLVPFFGLVVSAAVLFGGFYLAFGSDYGHPVSIEGRTGHILLALMFLVCGLIWLFLTQLTRLHESRENLRLTLQSSTDIVIILDNGARYVDIFAATDEQLIETPEKSRGKSVRMTMGDELGERVERLVTEVLTTGNKQTISYSVPLNAQVLWFEAVISKRDKTTVVAMIRDVTREYALQKELEDQRRFMENILNAISDPIFMKDEQHRWLYGNDAFSEMLGLTRDQYYGKTDSDFQSKEVAETYFIGDRSSLAPKMKPRPSIPAMGLLRRKIAAMCQTK